MYSRSRPAWPCIGAVPCGDESWSRNFIGAVLDAYWERGDDTISDVSGLAPLAMSLGVDPGEFEQETNSAAVRGKLASETGNALDSVFGAPSIRIGSSFSGARTGWNSSRTS